MSRQINVDEIQENIIFMQFNNLERAEKMLKKPLIKKSSEYTKLIDKYNQGVMQVFNNVANARTIYKDSLRF